MPTDAARHAKAADGSPAPGGASDPHAPPHSVTTGEPAHTTQAGETGTRMVETERVTEARDPQVEQLHALFPQVEVEIVEAVLAASGGSLDEATEQLLVMNDPEYKPDPVELSQLEADEEYARQLAREDEVAQMHERVNAPRRSSSISSTQQQQPQPLAYQPYVPRSRRTAQPGSPSPSMSSWRPPAEQARQQQQQQPAQERDELAELGEQFSKFAEQGKKTFGSFLTKVKEQVAKVDEAIVRSASPPQRDQPPKPDTSTLPSSSSARDLIRTSTNASTSSTTSSVVPELLPRPSSSASSNRSVSPSLGTSRGAKPVSTTASSASTVNDKPKDLPKKDFTSKIPGLLPRQSFSLLDFSPGSRSPSHEATSPGAAGGAGAGVVRSPLSAPNHALGDDSDDELEYQRNPFDED
ncbi:ubiquitin system component Cue [Rhodotorula toruloides]|uniref:Ubiquitin system component Cue n=1 Tax=Rhodotorula toruloides TaxID=5286 RepID=A0A511KIF0_RHOTO|nr:ubiquitin system component Cue [Rhodotorula toruloides]